jgi:uncharacterized membrane protein YhiD involved in acid resistance
VLYTHTFNVSIVMMTLVTTLIILCIYVNILLSLGMVGALSIIRFRTPIKDARDTMFLFWAIAVGISCGALFFVVAFVGTMFIGCVMVGFSLTQFNFRGRQPYILVLHYSPQVDHTVRSLLPKHQLRSRTVNADGVELTVEVRLRDDETRAVDRYLQVPGVTNAALVSYNGDYAS